jgi:hypothetical protein
MVAHPSAPDHRRIDRNGRSRSKGVDMLSPTVKQTMATALSGAAITAAIASTALAGVAQARVDAPLTAKSPRAHATVRHSCDPAEIIGVISFCNPGGHSRGPGAGAGRL